MSLLFQQPNAPGARPSAGGNAPDSSRTLIDDLLTEQQQLTAVERFSRSHENCEVPAQARYYRDLIPLGKPRPGEQYAFAVDLDACTGCKACVSACHSLNGLDEDETWRSVGLLHGGTEAEPYQQIVTTACHHCVEPACLNGCPVLAYEKDEETGIVRHLDDQCIGCQYCVLKCPYDVPKYSARRGIVRKCDMCHGRLAAGEAPACIQACPSGAISIQVVAKADIERICAAPGEQMLPGAFESSYTKPTTTYTSRKPMPANARAANAERSRSELAHWSLVWMLVLTQTAAGLFLWASLTALFKPQTFATGRIVFTTAGLVFLISGLIVSIFHLGRPLGAWRSFLGLRRSWMSREIVAFVFFALAAGATLWSAAATLAAVTAILGLLSVFCSAMIYVDTRRPSWAARLTFPKFFGTTLLSGSAAMACVLNYLALNKGLEIKSLADIAGWSAVIIRTALFVWEIGKRSVPLPGTQDWRIDDTRDESGRGQPHSKTLAGFLKRLKIPQGLGVRLSSAAFYVFWTIFGMFAIVGSGHAAIGCAVIFFFSIFTAQIFERYFFFTTSTAPRMPGTGAQ